jgi:phosphoglycolate phosphatase
MNARTLDVPTLVFDLDGTLVDSARDLMGTLNVILAREGAAPLPVEQAHSLLGAGARALLERGFAVEGRSIDKERMDVLYRDFLDHYADHLADESRAFDGVERSLAAFRATGARLAVCTNKVTWHSRKLLDALSLSPFFHAVCGRDAFPWFKPDGRHLTATIEEAGGSPSRAMMIGDSRTDLDAARNAAVPCILVDFGYTDVPAARLGADRVISHFDELAEAVAALAPSRRAGA